jgi:hypothetical protein
MIREVTIHEDMPNSDEQIKISFFKWTRPHVKRAYDLGEWDLEQKAELRGTCVRFCSRWLCRTQLLSSSLSHVRTG